MVVQAQVEAEGLAEKALEEVDIHLQQIFRDENDILFHCFSYEKSISAFFFLVHICDSIV